MHVTVCISTRNRGASIVATLRHLVAAQYDDFDVVIVDQSTTDATAQAVSELIGDDTRFTYLRTATRGSSVARNIAVEHARGPLLAFTDDDCEPSPDWLPLLVRHFARHPEVGQICGAVRAAPHDTQAGFIPTFKAPQMRLTRSRWLKFRAGGILANMAFRKEVFETVGPFDEVLGAGGPLFSYVDGDITYRVLRAGYGVLTVPDATVVHSGFRAWAEGEPFMRRVGLGIGATFFKHLRLGDLAVLPTLIYEIARCISWRRLLLLKPHTGLARLLWTVRGFCAGFGYRLNRQTRTYIPNAPMPHVVAVVLPRADPPLTEALPLALDAARPT